jgi:bifunctional pyridoxal-dependent enzyme with beta-cystathionase and maltose regulon repressor activities
MENRAKENKTEDLFNEWETLPKEVIRLLMSKMEFKTYKECDEFIKQLNKIGYTCEYGFDAVPYNLQKIVP